MKDIKYLLSLGLLLCVAAVSAQQFDAGSNTRFAASKIKSDKTRQIKDKTKIEAERETDAAKTQGNSKCKLCRGFAKTDYRYNVLTCEKYPARPAVAAQPAGTLTGDRIIRGMSPFVPWKYTRRAYYGFFGYATMDINKPTPPSFVYNSEHFNLGVQFDVRNMLKKAHWL